MAQQSIAPIIPNIGLQEGAMAGAQAVTFTATDRKVILEKSGEINKNRSFLEVFSKKPLTSKVENEETTVESEQNITELEGRYRKHRQILRNSPIAVPREHVEITGATPETLAPFEDSDKYEKPSDIKVEEIKGQETEISEKTAALARDLNLNPSELFDKFSLEQNKLYSIIYRIKELHLKRLLCNRQEEFETLSEAIKRETLAAARCEAHVWLEAQLDNLTRGAAQYKLNLLKSLKSMHFDDEQSNNVKWLQEIIVKLS